MSVLTLEAKLERVDPSTPWGFRMQGGKDFHSPLSIQRVNPGSLAAKCGLQQGDIILKIGSVQSETLKHKEAQDSILNSGNKLDLLLQRGNVSNQTYVSTPTVASYTLQNSGPTSPAGSSTSGGGGQNYNQSARPFGSTPSKPGYGVDNLSQKTSQMSFNPKPVDYQSASQKYAEREEKPTSTSMQSKSFKFLKDTLDSGQELPSALRPVTNQRSVSPNTVLTSNTKPRQFNSPSGLYSDQNVAAVQKVQASSDSQHAPPPPSAPKPPPAQKQAVWTPGGSQGGVSSAPKPFSPTIQPSPPAPGGPHGGGTPPKPTGVGAVRGKRGEAAMFKSGDSAPGGNRVPTCNSCGMNIRGPFVVALGKTWCPDHFVCANPRCGTKLLDIGFVEEGGFLYCEKDYELHFAPHCAVCGNAIVGECVNALQKTYHPGCFTCAQCKKPIGGNQFHLEDGKAYCEDDWRQMFQTMCHSCDFPIEPGDNWVEAMTKNYHSGCFNCSTCQINLEGQPFFAKAGKPYCKQHAR